MSVKDFGKRRFLTGIGAALVLLGSAHAATAQQSFDWKRFAGTTISVSLKKNPWTDALTPRLAEFEALTGIKARVEVLPENQQREKLTVALTAGNAEYDVYASQRHNEGLQYLLAGWYEPIDKYLKDPTMTPPDFNFADFLPSAINDVTIRGTLTSIPIYSEAIVLTYRKDLFQEAGLKVPETLDELEAAAKKLTDKSKGQYGICVRGLGVAASGIVGTFFHSMGAKWTNADFNPTLTTPEMVQGFEYYGRLAREYGPPGVLNYHWFQCQSLIGSGKGAMWIDANSVMNPLLDPAKSQVSDKLAFAVVPAGKAGRIPGFGTNGLSIYPGSKNKGAAWYFIAWATSAQTALNAQLNAGVPASRGSPWKDAAVQKDTRYAELRDITLKTMELKELSSFSPPWVAVSQIRDIIGVVIVTAIQNGDVRKALETAQGQIQDLRKKTEGVK